MAEIVTSEQLFGKKIVSSGELFGGQIITSKELFGGKPPFRPAPIGTEFYRKMLGTDTEAPVRQLQPSADMRSEALTEFSKLGPSTKVPQAELPFEAQYPNVYGVGGAVWETMKGTLPYVKYFDPSEVKRFKALSVQEETRELLFEALNAIVLGRWKGLEADVKYAIGAPLKKYFPKTYAKLTSPLFQKKMDIPQMKGAVPPKPPPEPPTAPQKPLVAPKKAEGIPVPQQKGGVGKKTLPEREIEQFGITTEELAQIERGEYLGFGPASQFQKMYDSLVKGKKSKVELRKGKYAGSINVDKQNIPQEFKEFEAEVSALAPKKTQTWDQTGKLSKEILISTKKSAATLGKAKRGEGLNTEEIDAVRQINVNAISRLKEIAETESPKIVNEQFNNYVNDIFKPVSDASSEAGRALNIHKKDVSINRIGTAFAELKKGLNERQIKEFKELNFENPIEVKRFIDRLPDPKFKDYFYEFWYNSILSGISTHVVNIASNTGWAMWQLGVHRPFKALVDIPIAKLTGQQRKYYLSETLPAISGFIKSFKKGASGAWEMVKSGKTVEFETKWEREIGAMTVGAFERSPYKPLRAIAPWISPPTKALRAMDVWANTMAYDANIAAQARRTSIRQNVKPENRKSFETGLIKNPTEDMRTKAAAVAKHFTFMDDPGKITEWVIRGRDVIPAGRLVVPFVNTIANLTKRGIEMTPGVGLLLAKGRSSASVIASQIEGSILGLYILQKCDVGEITGSAPQNTSEREAFYRQGKKPWSIRLGGTKNEQTGVIEGGTWYQYRRIEPFNTVIASVAIAYDKIKNAKDEETATQIFGNIVEGLAENIIDSSYAQGVTNILDRYGQRKGIVQRQLSTLVPYSSFWRSINRSYEAATQGSAKIRDTKSFLGAFSQTIPGLSKKIPPKLNIWGDEIELEGGVFRQWLPYKWAKESTDPVEVELERLGVYPGFPQQKVTIQGKPVKLPDDLYRDYLIHAGDKMKTALDKLVTQRGYMANKNDELKKRIIDKMLTSIRQLELGRVKIEFVKKKLKRSYGTN